jgi:translation initiation factor 3 subunit B
LNADAPKFNDDFSNYFVISNLPKAEEAKVDKLKGILTKALTAKHFKVANEDIDMPLDVETQKTEGVAFVKMSNEDNARIGVAIFNGYKMTKKNIFVACLMSEFNKLMETSNAAEHKQLPTMKDLRSNILETKFDQYMYQCGKTVHVNNFSASSAQNKGDANQVTIIENASDKKVFWSPLGTYLIIIKADRVVFMGGSGNMREIITLAQSKADKVIMSPCERYVLTYSPQADVCFTVWNF